MANYFVLQENDESAAYAFKVNLDKYKPSRRKNQREQYTVTGALDVQIGPNTNMWQYGVKLTGGDSGNFVEAPGAIMTAASVTWGTFAHLATLFGRVVPPANKLRFRDLEGDEYYVFFTGELKTTPLSPAVTGSNVFLRVDIVLRSSE